jgi:uncharacterized membrane-anchored protein YhcB (DUF1043 family)
VDALGHLRHALLGDPAPDDDFFALRTALAECRGGQRTALQQRSRQRQLRATLNLIRLENEVVMQRLRTDAEQVEQERLAAQEQLQLMQRRLQGDADAESEKVRLAAVKTLNKTLDALVEKLTPNQTRAALDALVAESYPAALERVVRKVEKKGDSALHQLAGDRLDQPTPLTIMERMTLAALIQVRELPTLGPSGGAQATWAGIGATIGTIVAPGLGTAIGAGLGWLAANLVGSSTPDYAAAYAKEIEQQWQNQAAIVLTVLAEQFAARVAELLNQLECELAQVNEQVGDQAQPLAAELHERATLAQLLAQCSEHLPTGQEKVGHEQ